MSLKTSREFKKWEILLSNVFAKKDLVLKVLKNNSMLMASPKGI